MEQRLLIDQLKQQVLDSGYHPIQLNHIMKEVVDDLSLQQISISEERQLIEILQYYCDFAEKCKKINFYK